jgi:hypothetical protein
LQKGVKSALIAPCAEQVFVSDKHVLDSRFLFLIKQLKNAVIVMNGAQSHTLHRLFIALAVEQNRIIAFVSQVLLLLDLLSKEGQTVTL